MSRRILIPLLLAALMVPLAVAQDNASAPERGDRNDRGERGDRGRGGPGGPGGWTNRIKEQMGVTDDAEWKVIEAKLQPVMRKRMETMGGMFGGRGRGGDDDNRQRTGTETASRDLRTLLENKDATEDQIKEKLTSFREARDKARAELTALQKDLKEVLMPRQEAVLVTMGMLE